MKKKPASILLSLLFVTASAEQAMPGQGARRGGRMHGYEHIEEAFLTGGTTVP